jgi:predicted DNA-binding transcriptional regulator YafY
VHFHAVEPTPAGRRHGRMTIDEAADCFGVSRQTVYRRIGKR